MKAPVLRNRWESPIDATTDVAYLRTQRQVNGETRFVLSWSVGNGVTHVCVLNEDCSALDIYRRLSIKKFTGHLSDCHFEINGVMYWLTHEQWTSVWSCFDQWFEDYIRDL